MRVPRSRPNAIVLTTAIVAVLHLITAPPEAAGHPVAQHITVVLSRDIGPYRQTLAGLRRVLQNHRPAPTVTVIDLEGGDPLGAPITAATPEQNPHLIVAIGARAALSYEARVGSAPLLLAGASGPEIDGLIRRGSGRIFGVGLQIPFDLQFETLKEVLTQAGRVGVLHGIENREAIRQARISARRHGLTLVPIEIANLKEIPDALSDLLGQVDALWALPDATIYSPEIAPFIILQTLRQRVPFMSFSQNFVRAGSLLSLHCDLEDVGEQAGRLALAVLHGRDTAPAGMSPPRTVRLSLNLRVADVIGLAIPDAVRDRAHVVYE